MSGHWLNELIAQWLESIDVEPRRMPPQERLHMGFENGDRLCIEPFGELCQLSVVRRLPTHGRLEIVEALLRQSSFKQRGPFRISTSMMGDKVLILSMFFTREECGLSQLQQGLDYLRKHLSSTAL
ncbi:hypothetical protein SG34_032740 [Thalassomonas viridans]|uniref:Type III secretion chaperone SycN n=1 Tax=Thalassomonas viridans TaxID=137584 RepID=A0AAE9Z8F3_9GAMM|nr:hypothetical protein [Thalassomonas viridans]WDE08680.1 hypothetical protein SG34_032740 [Thalassomonas viridans]